MDRFCREPLNRTPVAHVGTVRPSVNPCNDRLAKRFAEQMRRERDCIPLPHERGEHPVAERKNVEAATDE